MEFQVSWLKRDVNGFGIYFAQDDKKVIIDGFVRENNDFIGEAEKFNESREIPLRRYDQLIQINNVNIETKEFKAVIDALRSAPIGMNDLKFKRQLKTNNWPVPECANAPQIHQPGVPIVQYIEPANCLQLVIENTARQERWSSKDTQALFERLNELEIYTAQQLSTEIVQVSFARVLQTANIPRISPEVIHFMEKECNN